MPETLTDLRPGPRPRTVRAEDGALLVVPADWDLLPPGDAAVTKAVKALGPTWAVAEKRGRKRFGRGLWAPALHIAQARAAVAAQRADPAHQRRLEAGRRRRAVEQEAYVADFRAQVLGFLRFHPRHAAFAAAMAERVTAHATPVGSGTVARTTRIPVERRAEAAVIAWMRHQTTAYDDTYVPRVKGARRELRRALAERSRALLGRYRQGLEVAAGCPLAKALALPAVARSVGLLWRSGRWPALRAVRPAGRAAAWRAGRGLGVGASAKGGPPPGTGAGRSVASPSAKGAPPSAKGAPPSAKGADRQLSSPSAKAAGRPVAVPPTKGGLAPAQGASPSVAGAVRPVGSPSAKVGPGTPSPMAATPAAVAAANRPLASPKAPTSTVSPAVHRPAVPASFQASTPATPAPGLPPGPPVASAVPAPPRASTPVAPLPAASTGSPGGVTSASSGAHAPSLPPVSSSAPLGVGSPAIPAEPATPAQPVGSPSPEAALLRPRDAHEEAQRALYEKVRARFNRGGRGDGGAAPRR